MKNSFWLLVIALFCIAAVQYAAAQNGSTVSKVLALERKWNEVYQQGDVAGMNSLLDDDFIITVEDGSTFSSLDTSRITETLWCT